MASAIHQLILTKLDGTTPTGYGMLAGSVRDRQGTVGVKKARTYKLNVPIDHPRADAMMDGDCLLKWYRILPSGARQLMMVGETLTAEEVAKDGAEGIGGTIAAVYGDPLALLIARLIGVSLDAHNHGAGFASGTAGAQKDLTLIIQDVLNAVNGVSPTGVTLGATQQLASVNGYLGPVYFKSAGEAIAEICAGLGGPDFELTPVEPSSVWPNTVIANLNIFTKQGTAAPNAVFEFGTGKSNCTGYRRVVDRQGIANKVWNLPPGFPDANAATDIPVSATDATSIAARRMREDNVAGDLSVGLLRQGIVDAHVAIRKLAKQQVFFTPASGLANPPMYGADFGLGDIVTARAKVGATTRLNAACRVYSATFTPDDNDVETVELGLIPDSESV